MRRTPHKRPEIKILPSNPEEKGELRQDMITGKWVVVAIGRSRRPDDFSRERTKPRRLPKYQEQCPFCNLADFPQEPDILRLPDDPDTWAVHVFRNKYPAFVPQDDIRSWSRGPYRAMESVGYHELLATRWHNQIEPLMTQQELALELEALVLRYRQLKTKSSVNYIQIINNHGQEAGGSLAHPHHQIFTVPVLPDDIQDLLRGAEAYAQEQGKDGYEVMLQYERAQGERLVWENDDFTAFCPYASRFPFEVWIMPRRPEPFFENIGPGERESLAEIMQQVLGRLYTGLHDPPYNYYILSAPCDETGFVCNVATFQHFRWHIQITPRLNAWGGFEIGSGLEITTTLPETSAAFLREQKVARTI
ncbi:MAG: galactose-1-phosphate uridylyltransferase [Candidatus Andersenbacteria bacterium]